MSPRALAARSFWIGVVATLAFGAAEFWAGRASPAPAVSQVGFQLAFSAQRARDLLAGWGEDAPARLRTVILLDFGFILGYVLLLGGAAAFLARSGVVGDRQGSRAVYAAVAAGVFDVLENAAMLRFLADPAEERWMPLAGASAVIKLTLFWGVAAYLVFRVARAFLVRR